MSDYYLRMANGKHLEFSVWEIRAGTNTMNISVYTGNCLIGPADYDGITDTTITREYTLKSGKVITVTGVIGTTDVMVTAKCGDVVIGGLGSASVKLTMSRKEAAYLGLATENIADVSVGKLHVMDTKSDNTESEAGSDETPGVVLGILPTGEIGTSVPSYPSTVWSDFIVGGDVNYGEKEPIIAEKGLKIMTGGYKIIDLKNANLTTGQPVEIEGVYEAIESNYRKALLVEGLVIAGKERSAVWVEFISNGSNFVGKLSDGTLTVSENDGVTYTAN